MINYRRFGGRRLLPVREIEFPTVFGITLRARNFELMSGNTDAAKSGRPPMVQTRCGGAAAPIRSLPLHQSHSYHR